MHPISSSDKFYQKGTFEVYNITNNFRLSSEDNSTLSVNWLYYQQIQKKDKEDNKNPENCIID